ncbi:hypothetical protein BT96DRAFT_603353 [Gymnopus androsaceus JB14]|uniref:Uncharacterized protein n=1 Tax=Gymnopus androsaceus JB14 TaxID=1447944 RepID=A0A6A4HTK1_9AGAR|nr:hypothetical protein BT96DRAFT_603353 [Gymnopus androsaceus JB14]
MSASSSASSSAESRPRNTLETAREQLLNNSTVYIADANAVEELDWFTDDASQESYVFKKTDEVPEGEAPEPILLSALGEITRDDTFVVPDCRYEGPRFKEKKTLKDIKLTIALGKSLRHPMLAEEFDKGYSAMENLRQIRLDKMMGYGKVNGFIAIGKEDQLPKLKFGHEVFKDRDHDTGADIEFTNPEFTLAGYPVKSDNAKEELEAMVQNRSHELLPLPAFEQLPGDPEPRMILPSQYVSRLQGAVVKVEFYLTHIRIKSENKNVFMADVFSIMVVAPPLETPRKSLSKRKATRYPHDREGSPSPMKRVRISNPTQ